MIIYFTFTQKTENHILPSVDVIVLLFINYLLTIIRYYNIYDIGIYTICLYQNSEVGTYVKTIQLLHFKLSIIFNIL